MADNGLVVDLRNFNQVFHIHFVELYVIEIGVAGGITEFRGEIVGVFGLCVLHFNLPFAIYIAFTFGNVKRVYTFFYKTGTWTLETSDEGIADELLHSTVCSKSEDPQSVRDTIPASRYRLSRVVGCKDNSIVRISFIYLEKKAQ